MSLTSATSRSRLAWARMDSPVGPILVAADRQGLRAVALAGNRPLDEVLEALRRDLPGRDWVRDPAPVQEALDQLRAYFAGRLTRFALRLAPEGTAFQKRVWRALVRIPYGETRTYGQVARAVGRPEAARAVGQACHRNPLAIVIPCHRVVGADGRLTGYAPGLDMKRALLELEGRRVGNPREEDRG